MFATSRSDETVESTPGVFSSQMTRRTPLMGAGTLLASTAWKAEAFAQTPPSTSSVIGLSLEELSRVERVIALAGGQEKTLAIAGALRAGVIDILVTDKFKAAQPINL